MRRNAKFDFFGLQRLPLRLKAAVKGFRFLCAPIRECQFLTFNALSSFYENRRTCP